MGEEGKPTVFLARKYSDGLGAFLISITSPVLRMLQFNTVVDIDENLCDIVGK